MQIEPPKGGLPPLCIHDKRGVLTNGGELGNMGGGGDLMSNMIEYKFLSESRQALGLFEEEKVLTSMSLSKDRVAADSGACANSPERRGRAARRWRALAGAGGVRKLRMASARPRERGPRSVLAAGRLSWGVCGFEWHQIRRR